MGDLTAPTDARLRATAYDLVLRPRRSLVRSTILSVVFSAVPLAVALVWVSLPLRLWTFVASVVIAVAVLVAVAFVRLTTAYVGIDAAGVTVRGVVTPTRRIERSDVHGLVVATTYGTAVERTTRELVVLGPDGAHRFRLRADTWGDEAIDSVVECLGVQVTEEARPVSLREFVRRYPTTRSWYEHRWSYAVAGGLAVVAIVGLLAAEATGLLGS